MLISFLGNYTAASWGGIFTLVRLAQSLLSSWRERYPQQDVSCQRHDEDGRRNPEPSENIGFAGHVLGQVLEVGVDLGGSLYKAIDPAFQGHHTSFQLLNPSLRDP